MVIAVCMTSYIHSVPCRLIITSKNVLPMVVMWKKCFVAENFLYQISEFVAVSMEIGSILSMCLIQWSILNQGIHLKLNKICQVCENV